MTKPKRCYVPTPENFQGWELTIREQRKELRLLLKYSPSLRNYLTKVFDEIWQSALVDMQQDYPAVEFPDRWQFSQEVDTLLSEQSWR